MTTHGHECQNCSSVCHQIRVTRAEARHRSRATCGFLGLAVVAGCLACALGGAYGETGALIPRIETMAPADRAPTKGSSFVLRTSLPSAPVAVRIYRVRASAARKPIFVKLIKALPVNATLDVQRIVKKIERTPEPILGVGDDLGGSIGNWTIRVFSGGAYSCDRRRRVSTGKVRPPSAESVRRVADSFLTRAGPMPNGLRFSGVGATESIDGTAVSWSAAYRGDIDGIPVRAALSVEVGPDLELLSVLNTFREVVADRMLPILSPQEAFDLLCRGEGRFHGTTIAPSKRDVESVRLMYWQAPLAQDFDCVVPIYEFGGVETHGARREQWSAFVEAIRPEYLEKPRGRL